MGAFTKSSGIVVLFFVLTLVPMSAAQSTAMRRKSTRARATNVLVTLGTQIGRTTLDCSHFVNSLFEQVGLYYRYEPSIVLYSGTPAFKRVYQPVSGDLVVWPGHVGIVVDPNEKTFVSALHSGVKVASYTSSYWRGRGRARFFRYRLPVAESTPTWEASLFQSPQRSSNSGLE
jgi:cell wall-associated NlpC family hydrolase